MLAERTSRSRSVSSSRESSKWPDSVVETRYLATLKSVKSQSKGLAHGVRGKGQYITDEDAANFMDAYFDRFEGVAEWKEGIEEESPRQVRSIMGRVRRFDSDGDIPAKLNSALQSTCADALKRAMVDLQPRLQEMGARIVMCVHDELVIESPKECAEEVQRIVDEEMTSAMETFVRSVPIKVDASIRDSWAADDE